MNKIVVKILICISILIIAFVFVATNGIEEFLNESKTSDKVYLDGSDVTDAVDGFAEIGTLFLKFIIILYGGVALTGIWGIYGIVSLIIFIIKKIKENKEIINEEDLE